MLDKSITPQIWSANCHYYTKKLHSTGSPEWLPGDTCNSLKSHINHSVDRAIVKLLSLINSSLQSQSTVWTVTCLISLWELSGRCGRHTSSTSPKHPLCLH